MIRANLYDVEQMATSLRVNFVLTVFVYSASLRGIIYLYC